MLTSHDLPPINTSDPLFKEAQDPILRAQYHPHHKHRHHGHDGHQGHHGHHGHQGHNGHQGDHIKKPDPFGAHSHHGGHKGHHGHHGQHGSLGGGVKEQIGGLMNKPGHAGHEGHHPGLHGQHHGHRHGHPEHQIHKAIAALQTLSADLRRKIFSPTAFLSADELKAALYAIVTHMPHIKHTEGALLRMFMAAVSEVHLHPGKFGAIIA